MPSTESGSASRPARGRRADQLLEVERVAVGARDDARRPIVVGDLAQRLAHQLLARPLRQRRRGWIDLRRARLPQLREPLVDLGPRQRQHHERRVAQVAQRGVDEADGAEVAPVQVLEHQQHRLRGALGRQPVLPGAAHGVAHQLRVARAPRAARRCRSSGNGTLAISPRNAATRARGVAIDVARDPRARASRAGPRCGSPSGCRRRAGSRARASRTASRRPASRRRRTAPRRRSGCRCTHSTNSCRSRDLPMPAAPTTSTAAAIDSASVARVQVRSASTSRGRARRRRSPCRAGCAAPRTRRARRAGTTPSRRARISKRASSSPPRRRRARIAPGARPAQQAHAVVDHLARHRPGREPPRPVDTTQRHVGQHGAHRQRAAGGARRLIGRLAGVGQRQHHRPVRERVQPRAVHAHADRPRARARRRSCAARQRRRRRRPTAARSAAPAPLGGRATGPAITTQAMRCSLAVSAGLAPRRRGSRRAALDSAERRRARRAPRSPRARRRAGARGSLASMRATRSSSGRGSRGTMSRSARRLLRAGSWRAAPSRPRPRTPARPVRHWNSTQPSENTSARGVMSRSPRTCSGAM